jgi:1,4-dihydroxy-2-naphthoyl-CoA hydrolase
MADPIDFVAMINANLGGWNSRMGLRFTTVNEELCVAELVVAEQHLQPYGIVHGGVHTGIIEAACSTGAAFVAISRGQAVVGLENSTAFITAVRSGTLRVTATPVTRGRRTQVWQGVVTNEAGKTCATGRVRLLCLDAGSDLAGKAV